MVQIVDVHVDVGEEFRLINFHIVSGQGIVAVKANYGRGADVAYNNHTLANGIRKDCATAVLAHGQRSRAALIGGLQHALSQHAGSCERVFPLGGWA